MLTDELKEAIQILIHYYNHHGIRTIIKTHPDFVADDFTHLLKALDKELFDNN